MQRRTMVAVAAAGVAALGLGLAGLALADSNPAAAETETPTAAAAVVAAPPAQTEPAPESPGTIHGEDPLELIATAMGVDRSIVLEGLRNGQSLAEIATANGVDPAVVEAALSAEAERTIDAAEAAGLLTPDEAESWRRFAADTVAGAMDLPFGFVFRLVPFAGEHHDDLGEGFPFRERPFDEERLRRFFEEGLGDVLPFLEELDPGDLNLDEFEDFGLEDFDLDEFGFDEFDLEEFGLENFDLGEFDIDRLLDELVAKGHLTREQADSLRDGLGGLLERFQSSTG